MHDLDLTVSYADTAIAFLEAAGMASWAHTVEYSEFTLERFGRVVALTPAEAGADEAGHSDPARGAQGIAMQAAAGMLEGAGMAATAWLELSGEGLDPEYDLARLRGKWDQQRAPAAD